MKIKVISVICAILIVGFLTGCGNKSTILDNGTKLEQKGNAML